MSTLSLKEPPKKPTRHEKNIAASVFFFSLDVIKDERLLTYGFKHELFHLYSKLRDPIFGYKRLQARLSQYCSTDKYKELDTYGIRYNVQNKPTHQLNKVGGQ